MRKDLAQVVWAEVVEPSLVNFADFFGESWHQAFPRNWFGPKMLKNRPQFCRK